MESWEESEGDDPFDHDQQSIAFEPQNRLANRKSISVWIGRARNEIVCSESNG